MKTGLILLCGATGFIGRNLLNYFGQDPNLRIRAVNYSRQPFDTSGLSANIEWVKADLRRSDEVEKVMKGVDVVIQAAATTSGSKDIVSKPYIHVTDNAVMNSLLLREAFHQQVSHFLFFSCTVMYNSSDKLLSEDDFDPRIALNSRYFGVGHTKLYIEKMLEFYSQISNMKTTAIRHSNIYGPFDKFDFERSHVFGATISKVMTAQNEISIWGSGEEERDLLHIDDLCSFVRAALERQQRQFGLYNCGLGEKISVKDLVRLIRDKSGRDLEIKYDTSKPTIKTRVVLDIERASKELLWEPQVKISEGVLRTLDWWNKNIDRQTLKIIGE